MMPFLPISHYFPNLKVHNITFFAFWISWQLQVYSAIYSQNITKSLKNAFGAVLMISGQYIMHALATYILLPL